MKANKLTQGHNLIWESSRMMLPEHKELLQYHQKKISKQEKPQLDEQEIECLESQINDALKHQYSITLTLFNSYEPESITGIIEKIEPSDQRIFIKTASGEKKWISFSQITQVNPF